jgi:DNA end-binding protein Ku
MDPDMLDLAAHIIDRKKGSFDPKGFEDRYEDALAELVKAKMEGRTIQKPKAPKVTKISSLMDALRQSVQSPQAPPPSSKKRTSAPKAKKPKKAA